MDFNNSSTEEGLIQEINRICNASDATYSLKAKTARINMALDRFFTLAFRADGRWSFDDMNQTAPPIQSINLVANQSRYELDDFASEIINVLRVEIKDENGNGVLLRPLSLEEIREDYDEFWETAGTPVGYLKIGEFIDLKPAPSYSSTSGLTLYFERNKDPFVSTDTTKDPGIPSVFHGYLARHASLPFLIEKGKPQANAIKQLVMEDEAAITEHFAHRDKDVPMRLVPKVGRRR